MTGHLKCFDEIKYKTFLINDEELLDAYNKIWKRVINYRISSNKRRGAY